MRKKYTSHKTPFIPVVAHFLRECAHVVRLPHNVPGAAASELAHIYSVWRVFRGVHEMYELKRSTFIHVLKQINGTNSDGLLPILTTQKTKDHIICTNVALRKMSVPFPSDTLGLAAMDPKNGLLLKSCEQTAPKDVKFDILRLERFTKKMRALYPSRYRYAIDVQTGERNPPIPDAPEPIQYMIDTRTGAHVGADEAEEAGADPATS